MKLSGKFLLFILLTVFSTAAFATHYRAGEILYTHIGTGYTYQATVITYTKISGQSAFADRDSVTINWGDGTSDIIYRVNGPVVGQYPNGVVVLTDVKKNEYVGEHTYPGPPTAPHGQVPNYIISFYDVNRLAGIANMAQGNSVNVPFYVEDTIFFPTSNSLIGQFSSPVLANPAVQYAAYCDTFITNPEAIDSAADSITYVLVPCKQDQADNVPQYIFPDAFCNSQQGCLYPNNSCVIDFHTGNFTWADPCEQGFFNVGILLHIYRHGVCLGTMLRDFQMIVQLYQIQPPQLHIPADTCIWAGSELFARITAVNPNPNPSHDTLILSATGGPFVVIPPASFPTAETTSSTTLSFFTWNTDCDDIQLQPYFVYFQAQYDYLITGVSYPLEDFATWRINVIPPPVQGLAATTTNTGVVLTWHNPYACASMADFHGFSVWRKVGCDSALPTYCETGLAGTGYVKLTTNNIFNYTYTDNTVVPGQAYSYRVLAEFFDTPPDGDTLLAFNFQESVPDTQVCINAPVDVPVIINADVRQTSTTNGQIYVRWYKPLAGDVNLDTIAAPPVYRFDLYRSSTSGFNFSTPGNLIGTWSYNTFSSIPDTVSMIDSLINTVAGAWSYKVYFYANSNQDTIGTSDSASSTFLTIQPSDRTLYLRWNYNVPWANDSFTVFRQNHVTSIFDSIGIAYTNAYTDTGLINDTTYCYYIKDFGYYTATGNSYPAPLINRSQIVCNAPVDTIPPCPPVINVINDCGSYLINQPCDTAVYINYLTWHIVSDSCDINLQYFNIYFSANDSTNYVKIDSNVPMTDTSFNHILNGSLAGCYAITAVSRAGYESKFSNVVCVDNCPHYVLPNAFTPNGDGHNDLFHPFLPYCFITKIDMKIYNRWGELVFQTNDPMINWDGTDLHGKPVSEGVYLYAGYYYEQRLNGVVRMPLSGEKKGGGFIQLIRK